MGKKWALFTCELYFKLLHFMCHFWTWRLMSAGTKVSFVQHCRELYVVFLVYLQNLKLLCAYEYLQWGVNIGQLKTMSFCLGEQNQENVWLNREASGPNSMLFPSVPNARTVIFPLLGLRWKICFFPKGHLIHIMQGECTEIMTDRGKSYHVSSTITIAFAVSWVSQTASDDSVMPLLLVLLCRLNCLHSRKYVYCTSKHTWYTLPKMTTWLRH